ncbi:MAG: hypothetical protein QOJ70_1506 [Acidobacteriota bacterium]|jgi:hypothetical protein|nr:hypothetical protein [Acidobacteriota bacterium]
MTSQDHNKVIGIMHLIWGGFNALLMLLMIPFIIILLGPMGSDPTPSLQFKAVFGMFWALIIGITTIFAIPPLIAAYGMLKRKSWGRIAGIVAAFFTAFSMPFGTALCVYTLWFLFGQGEQFYRGAKVEDWRGSLRDANTFDWEAQRTSSAGRDKDYVPPPQPPDWRS